MALPPTPSPTPGTPWSTTSPLSSGPLVKDYYDYEIPSNCAGVGTEPVPLSANTLYQYRAFIVVDGVPYYGDACVTTTLPLVLSSPVVTTGNASDITCTTMRICDNTVDNKGNLLIDEYGVLYTQNPLYSTDGTFVVGNYPLNVNKKSVCTDIATGSSYFIGTTCEITGLNDNTTTFYRAFAINDCGVGYGNICCAQTLCVPETCVYLTDCCEYYCECCLVCVSAKIGISPALSAGQCFRLCYCNEACSCSDHIIKATSACAHLNASTDCAKTQISDLSQGIYYCCETGYVNIDCDTVLSNYEFFAIARTHYGNVNPSNNYLSCGSVCLTSLAAQVCGNYVIGDVRHLYAVTCRDDFFGGFVLEA